LYKELEDKFHEEVENRSLYERKRVLEEIRSFKRPIQKEDFEDHQRKYEDELERKMEQRLQERERNMSAWRED
jgi:hypothetical protein